MKRYAVPLTALLGLPTVAPAQFAQVGPPADIAVMPNQLSRAADRRDIRHAIRAAQRAGDISPAQARSLRREDAAIGSLGERFGKDGLSLSEEQELQVRTEALRGMVHARRVLGRSP